MPAPWARSSKSTSMSNRNGIPDFVLWNRDLSGNTTLTDGRQVSALLRLNATGTTIVATIVRFFAEHATNTANTVSARLRQRHGTDARRRSACGSSIPTTSSSSWYFGGPADELSPTAIRAHAGRRGVQRRRATLDTLAPSQDANVTVTRSRPACGRRRSHAGLMLIRRTRHVPAAMAVRPRRRRR